MEAITPVARLNCHKELTTSEILNYFEEYTASLTPTYPPMNAKAGELYLYLIQDDDYLATEN